MRAKSYYYDGYAGTENVSTTNKTIKQIRLDGGHRIHASKRLVSHLRSHVVITLEQTLEQSTSVVGVLLVPHAPKVFAVFGDLLTAADVVHVRREVWRQTQHNETNKNTPCEGRNREGRPEARYAMDDGCV